MVVKTILVFLILLFGGLVQEVTALPIPNVFEFTRAESVNDKFEAMPSVHIYLSSYEFCCPSAKAELQMASKCIRDLTAVNMLANITMEICGSTYFVLKEEGDSYPNNEPTATPPPVRPPYTTQTPEEIQLRIKTQTRRYLEEFEAQNTESQIQKPAVLVTPPNMCFIKGNYCSTERPESNYSEELTIFQPTDFQYDVVFPKGALTSGLLPDVQDEPVFEREIPSSTPPPGGMEDIIYPEIKSLPDVEQNDFLTTPKNLIEDDSDVSFKTTESYPPEFYDIFEDVTRPNPTARPTRSPYPTLPPNPTPPIEGMLQEIRWGLHLIITMIISMFVFIIGILLGILRYYFHLYLRVFLI